MNNKDLKSVVREFVANISDSDVESLASRLTHRMSGDMAFALNFMGKNRSMDQLLGSAKSADELYDLCDEICELLQQECKKKGLVLTKGPIAV